MRTITLCLVCSAAVTAAATPAVVATGSDPDRENAAGPLPLAAGGLIYLTTDKPLYRPGETIWIRGWEVDAALAAVAGDHGATLALVDPRGGVAVEKHVKVEAGALHNDIAIAADLAGGRYTLRVTSDTGVAEERAVTISTYEVPRLKESLDFPRRGYAPGDRVSAVLTVVRATGEPARGATVTGIATIDGVEIARPTATVGPRGKAVLAFTLPAAIARGDGLLTAVVTDGGSATSIQRRIPIDTGVVAIAAYPEGGDLVAGLASRVYFTATSPLGDPVDASGRVVDDRGAEVARFATAFRGRGTFTLTPAPGRTYQAIVDRPATGGAPIGLPAARADGCVLAVADADQVRRGELTGAITCTGDRELTVVAVERGREVGRARGTAAPALPVRLPLDGATTGVIRLTVSDARGPLAERLVFRKLGAALAVTVRADRDGYAPRDPVTVTVETRDATGAPVAAELAVAAVDDAVVTLADDHQAQILARMLLLPEMPGQTIDDPNFYFSADPTAPAALDLVLGTQGWRRFRGR